jgi:hypothetical protein
VSSSHEITWSDSAAGSTSFNSEAAAVGRAETGVFHLSGLFGLSGWPDRQTHQGTKETRETK